MIDMTLWDGPGALLPALVVSGRGRRAPSGSTRPPNVYVYIHIYVCVWYICICVCGVCICVCGVCIYVCGVCIYMCVNGLRVLKGGGVSGNGAGVVC
jgi:hypothetical protein